MYPRTLSRHQVAQVEKVLAGLDAENAKMHAETSETEVRLCFLRGV